MKGNFARSILYSLVTSVDFGWYSSIVGVCSFFCGALSCCVIAARGHARSATDTATKTIKKKLTIRREFIEPLGLELPAYLRTGERTSDAESSAGISGNASLFRSFCLAVRGRLDGIRNGMSVKTKLTDRQEHNSPKSAPACQQPANGNRRRHGTMSVVAAACSD